MLSDTLALLYSLFWTWLRSADVTMNLRVPVIAVLMICHSSCVNRLYGAPVTDESSVFSLAVWFVGHVNHTFNCYSTLDNYQDNREIVAHLKSAWKRFDCDRPINKHSTWTFLQLTIDRTLCTLIEKNERLQTWSVIKHICSVFRYLDFINLMSYDLHGSWDSVTGHNSPLYALPTETGWNAYLNVVNKYSSPCFTVPQYTS